MWMRRSAEVSPRLPRIVTSYDDLYRMHWTEKKSYRKIADELGCAVSYVHKLMKSLGVPTWRPQPKRKKRSA